MKLSAILEPLIAAGVPGDVLLATVRAFEDQREDALEKRRESDRQRQATKRELDALSRDSRDPSTVTRDSSLVRDRVAPVEGNSTNKQEKEERKKDSAAKPRGDLDAFKSELSSILDIERIEALVAVRRKKGATFSAHAGSLLVVALKACPDIPAAADEMVLRNWTGIKPEWLQSRHQKPTPPDRPPRNAGEYARQELQRMGLEQDATSSQTRYLDQGDGSPDFAGNGIARRFAIASSR